MRCLQRDARIPIHALMPDLCRTVRTLHLQGPDLRRNVVIVRHHKALKIHSMARQAHPNRAHTDAPTSADGHRCEQDQTDPRGRHGAMPAAASPDLGEYRYWPPAAPPAPSNPQAHTEHRERGNNTTACNLDTKNGHALRDAPHTPGSESHSRRFLGRFLYSCGFRFGGVEGLSYLVHGVGSVLGCCWWGG